MPETRTYQITVVGAGPAGAMAAWRAAAGGRRVCLLERKSRVGTPVRCGEGIGLKGMTASLDIDKRWILATVSKACFVSPAGLRVTLADIDESYVIDRTVFDADLVERARDAGAEYFPHTPVTGIARREDGRYRCVTPRGAFDAPCVILADGIESNLARDAGWDTSLKLEDLESCAFCHVTHPGIADDTVCFHVGSGQAPGGFAWVFPRGKGRANVGLGVLGTFCEPGKARRCLHRFVESRFPGASADDEHCGGVPVGRWTRPLVRGGIMLAGDAARQVNSLSGAGIGYGLYAGRLAGDVAARACSGEGCDQGALQQYQKEWASGLGIQQDRSYALKSMLLTKNNDAFFDRIARAFARSDPKRLNYKSIFLRTFARHPLMMLKVLRLFR
ncbi:MAG: geranylgeranyl reductase family protein [Chitinivibrionales bacterium]|nr:geranylgeranyl reductase family protein [Chitinivibrionales bacterium]MBD3394088.1 geranylgeranyl reductase family protein [Chitinivibrionales bacterium]